MGGNQSAIQLSVSKSSVDAGEYVTFAYRSNIDQDFPPNSIYLEVMSPYRETLLKKELKDANDSISFRVPQLTGTLTARIVDTTILEDGEAKIHSTVTFRVNKTVIDPAPVKVRGVQLSLRSPPFCDSPQIIDIARDGGVRSHDYLEFHTQSGRVNWYWCEGKTFIDFGIQTSLQDEQITIKYFEEGRTFTVGTLVAEMQYTLRNPIEELRMSSSKLEIQEQLQLTYRMAHVPNNCMIVGRFLGVRIFTHAVSMEGECTITMPRLPGEFEIACIATPQGERQLAVRKVTVTDRQNRSRVSLNLRGYAKDHRLLSIRPNQRFDVEASGLLLTAADQVVLVKASSLFEPPTHTSLAFAIQEKSLGERGVCSFELATEGMYHICLGLAHDRVNLLGDWCSVVVSNRVGTNLHAVPTEPIPSLPVLPLPAPSTASEHPPTAGFICAICLDKTVCMKFDPCRHVCTCEDCCQLILSQGIRSCPMCKKEVKSWEKIFLA